MPSDREPADQDKNDNQPIENIKWMTERHVACLFILDTSDAMVGTAIDELNKGLVEFKRGITNNSAFYEHTKFCIDVALITFDDHAHLVQDFVPADQMEVPLLFAGGKSALGSALNLGMDLIIERKRVYNENGTPYYRPWICCMIGGGVDDDYLGAAKRLKEMERNKGVLGYCVGTTGFSRELMAEIFEKERIFNLTDLDYNAIFQFVSNSLAAIRNSESSAENDKDIPALGLRLAF